MWSSDVCKQTVFHHRRPFNNGAWSERRRLTPHDACRVPASPSVLQVRSDRVSRLDSANQALLWFLFQRLLSEHHWAACTWIRHWPLGSDCSHLFSSRSEPSKKMPSVFKFCSRRQIAFPSQAANLYFFISFFSPPESSFCRFWIKIHEKKFRLAAAAAAAA